jgi:hypothetical protein
MSLTAEISKFSELRQAAAIDNGSYVAHDVLASDLQDKPTIHVDDKAVTFWIEFPATYDDDRKAEWNRGYLGIVELAQERARTAN